MPQQVEILQNPTFQHLSTILLLYIGVWWKSVKGGFLIDDDMGLQVFSEVYDPAQDKLIDGYVKDGVEHKFLSYQPHLGFPGAFMRWHRLHIGKSYKVVGRNKKGHDIYGFSQSPFRHHVWSLICYGLSLILSYTFLAHQFGPNIAFPAVLLFAVHPVISQCVAWISGINYVYCLFFLLANYNILQHGLSYYLTIPLTLLCTGLASLSLLVGCFNFAVLWILGYHWEAFAALIIGLAIMFRDGTTVVNYRRGEFKKQNMTSSITPNLRKPIVMLKTFWYYLCLLVFPKSLGLYHEFGYHYSRKDEEPSAMFWLGLISLVGFGAAFWYGPLLAKFCVVWFLAYFALFSNFITANQFVVERYIFIPALAFCLMLGSIIYPYPTLFWFVVGLLAMRSALHIWTFRNHITFYTSNVMNFLKSEVAYGNLGAAYQSQGKSGTAYDMWVEATKINPYYDVPWYNMHALLKMNGDLDKSKDCLQRCMDAKVVHFQDTWAAQMKELDEALLKKRTFEALNREMNDVINAGNIQAVTEIRRKMDVLMGVIPSEKQ